MAFVVLVPMREMLKLKAYITEDHFDRLGKILLACGMVIAYIYGMEFFSAWWSESPMEREQFLWRATGESAWSFWLMVFCNLVPVQLLWFKRFRCDVRFLFALGIVINVGMWFERYNIMALSLRHGAMPSEWTQYAFTTFDYMILAGSFGMFFTQFLVLARIAQGGFWLGRRRRNGDRDGRRHKLGMDS